MNILFWISLKAFCKALYDHSKNDLFYMKVCLIFSLLIFAYFWVNKVEGQIEKWPSPTMPFLSLHLKFSAECYSLFAKRRLVLKKHYWVFCLASWSLIFQDITLECPEDTLFSPTAPTLWLDFLNSIIFPSKENVLLHLNVCCVHFLTLISVNF